MKKRISILLCTVILVSLCSCKQQEESKATQAPAQEDFLVAATLDPKSSDVLAPDGNEIFSFQFQDIEILIPEYPEAAQAIEDNLNAGIQSTREAAQSLSSWAQEEYAHSAANDWTAYYSRILYCPERMDRKVFSVSGTVDDFAGGAHSNVTAISATYDTATGAALSLEDVLLSEASLSDLQALTLDALEQRSETLELVDYEAAVASRFDLTDPASANWYFSYDGLVFYFSPYEIAAYGEGTIEAELSYENLSGILKEDYFPVKLSDLSNHSINAAKTDEIRMADFDTTFDVTVDEGGEEVAVFTHTTLAQVTLTTGYWNYFDDQYYTDQVLFAANRMTPQDLLKIQTYVPDTLPNLRLVFRMNATEQESVYISQSGKDGSILLLDEDDV